MLFRHFNESMIGAEPSELHPELIQGEKINVNYSPPAEVITSQQSEIQTILDKLGPAYVRLYLPNTVAMPNSAPREALRHTARGAIIKQDAGTISFDKLTGRGGEVPMMLVVKGVGAKYKEEYFHRPSVVGDKASLAFSMGSETKTGKKVDEFRDDTANEETYLSPTESPDIMLLTKHSYGRPYGAQTRPLAETALECSDALAGSGIKYTPEVAILPFSNVVKDKIVAATKRAGMPISADLAEVDLAEELMLYPQSTLRGLEFVDPFESDKKFGTVGRTDKIKKLVDNTFPTAESREHFVDIMADDLYWLLNWPARNSTLGQNDRLQWRKFNDFNLNDEKLRHDLALSRKQREVLSNDVPTILEGRRENFKNTKDNAVLDKIKDWHGGIDEFSFKAGNEWIPFVLKDLLVHPKYGCFVTDFESSEVEDAKTDHYSHIPDHELWIYNVLYEFLVMAAAIIGTSKKSELINILTGQGIYNSNEEIKDYQTFYDRTKEIYLKVLRKLCKKRNGEIEIKLSDDENEIEVTLHYREKSAGSKTFKFHLLDFIK